MRSFLGLITLVAILAIVAAPPASAQDYTAAATYEEIHLETGFTPDPVSRSLTAGGSVQVNIGNCDYGWVAQSPDFKLHYRAGSTFPLYLYANSDSDTMLLVNTPDGRWHCNDDYTGLDPLLHFSQPQSGRYDIWVGTYGPDMAPATLHISELHP